MIKRTKRRRRTAQEEEENEAKRTKRKISIVEKKRKKSDERRRRRRSYSSSSSSSSSSSVGNSDEERRKRKHRKRRQKYSSSPSSSSDSSISDEEKRGTKKKVVNKRLLEKLSARGETLEEREERRARKRAELIASKFGYTAEENPFFDPNLAEPFSWKKKEEAEQSSKKKSSSSSSSKKSRKEALDNVLNEITSVRKRREEREQEREEMEKMKREQARAREQENFDEWMRKEEAFHLQQQKQRSAIRLVEQREKPIDVLAKNYLLFALSDDTQDSGNGVKYREKYNALKEVENLEVELQEPHVFLTCLNLQELQQLLIDIDTFRALEKDATAQQPENINQDDSNTSILKYWDALYIVTQDEIHRLTTHNTPNQQPYAAVADDISKLFHDKSIPTLIAMEKDILAKLTAKNHDQGKKPLVIDTEYWQNVLQQLHVHLAKAELSDIHSRMLVHQLEKLQKRKDELAAVTPSQNQDNPSNPTATGHATHNDTITNIPKGVDPNLGNIEEELGLTDEIPMGASTYTWQDKYRPRKPRYFNRVKTGYDWNKYNITHYDHDNPPPKVVQGYKFNIFYPDLIDKAKTPQYFLEPADSPEFCILRFHAGPPYEDVAFKIINREWNKSRKRGFRSTFERGVLSLYFNFSHYFYRK